MQVKSVEQFRLGFPRLIDIQVDIKQVIMYYDGLVNGYCEYQDKTYYFVWVDDENFDYFSLRTYAVIDPPSDGNTSIDDGKIIGWFLEGEANYEKWNEYRKSNECKNIP